MINIIIATRSSLCCLKEALIQFQNYFALKYVFYINKNKNMSLIMGSNFSIHPSRMLYLAIDQNMKENYAGGKTHIEYHGSYYTPYYQISSTIVHITHNTQDCINIMLVVLTEKHLHLVILTKLCLFFVRFLFHVIVFLLKNKISKTKMSYMKGLTVYCASLLLN